ncbi:MAG: PQQ-binding-like beta-propeller repeat protein [Candidatus Thalassarchaeaceae archaeon]|jgi:outer membrane protein assembly factor BamB|nr:PQQ-binding-like beta-propeller repeat protein [Candidatus Thalassarchaeaceae archaeon]MDP6703306.1 PQQ-binding-like beta-propeller repeat protein [Candidatus Thalassarchaeaceae archaeon]MDP7004077.1 PQQ-binding-like beta-propeller repeat protein [Candidatus Thalassarchaeaceae archaeon]
MESRGLHHFASFARELDGECTLLRIFGDWLVAGSRLGDLACWSIGSGTEMWRCLVEGPCSDCDLEGDMLCVSESDKLHAVDIRTGDFLWSYELEGSSDLVSISGGVWATSSVYTIEIQDYTESSVWLLDKEGRLESKWGVVGRSWFLGAKSNLAIIGLSRPNCGYAKVTIGKNPEYFSTENNNPITTGVMSDEGSLYLGHSNGGISEITDEGSSSQIAGSASVTSITIGEDWLAGFESGRVLSGPSLGGWSTEVGGSVDVICLGPSLRGEKCVWSSSWSGKAKLSLLEEIGGEVQFEIGHDSRIGEICSAGRKISLGDSEGKIFLIEEEVLRRRFEQVEEGNEEEKKRSLIRSRIRGLRKE